MPKQKQEISMEPFTTPDAAELHGDRDLGNNCDEADLRSFRQACERRQHVTGEDDESVTAWFWGSGNWSERIRHPAGCSCGSPGVP